MACQPSKVAIWTRFTRCLGILLSKWCISTRLTSISCCHTPRVGILLAVVFLRQGSTILQFEESVGRTNGLAWSGNRNTSDTNSSKFLGFCFFKNNDTSLGHELVNCSWTINSSTPSKVLPVSKSFTHFLK